MVVFGQSGCHRAKVVVFGQKWLYSGKVVVFDINWLYSDKMVSFGQNWLHSGNFYLGNNFVLQQSGCIWSKVVVFGLRLLY